MTELEITLDFLEEPITAEFYALAGAPGRDGQDGQDGADGHTPVITASKQGHRTTVYVDGSAVAQIDDGADGQDGAKGDTGAAGHSPVVTASKSGKVTTVSVDGSPIATINDGEDGQDGQDGSDGQDGFSPSASVSKSGSTATITVTDKNGTTTATVSDGQDGADGQDGHTPVKGTDYWTAADKAEIVAEAAVAVDVPVTDVQVNGTSILSSGVANILMANYVGELLYDEITTEDLTELVVNTDLSGQPFEVMKLIAIFTAPQSTTGARDNFYGSAYVNLPNGNNNVATSFPSMTYPTATSTMMARVTLTVYPNMPLEEIVTIGTSEGNTANAQQMPKNIIVKSITGIHIYQSSPTKSLIPAGSRLRIYGIRA